MLSSRSQSIGNGLTYRCGPAVLPGMLVRVPLRNALAEGIVMDVREEAATHTYPLKDVVDIVHPAPLLSPALLKTARWMAEYYCCSLRHVLQTFLPAPPWSLLTPIRTVTYALNASATHAALRLGKRQQIIVDYLRSRDAVAAAELQQETGATSAALRALAERGVLVAAQRHETIVPPACPSEPNAEQVTMATVMDCESRQQPTLVIDTGDIDRATLYAILTARQARHQRGTIVLAADIASAKRLHARLQKQLGSAVLLVHSAQTPAEQRRLWRQICAGGANVVVGTRTALFSPMPKVGLVIVDDEHEWTYKNEQAPRYHARHTAEVFCKITGAKLVLCSATPSLESWRHAVGVQPRYALAHPGEHSVNPAVRVVDLTQEVRGKHYPLSAPLLAALEQRLRRNEQSVLLLNRRGSATGLLCLDCRKPLTSARTALPLPVHMINGKPHLVDQHAEEVLSVPDTCPQCRSPRLHPVGAGTQRVEKLLQSIFPTARVVRIDRDTLEEETLGSVLARAERGEIDILIGTQPVVQAADLPRVTLGAVLVADIGLSLPHFRAGERVVQHIGNLIRRVPASPHAEVLVQTFRPDAAEIALSAKRAIAEYLDAELTLRLQAGYPPITQMIRLIVRDGGEARAHAIVKRANTLESAACSAWAAAPLPGKRGGKWCVFLKGTHPRSALSLLDLRGLSVDVDPIDWD